MTARHSRNQLTETKGEVRTPAALRKLSAMRLRRGWPRSRKPPWSNPGSSFSSDRLSLSNLLPPPFMSSPSDDRKSFHFLHGINVPELPVYYGTNTERAIEAERERERETGDGSAGDRGTRTRRGGRRGKAVEPWRRHVSMAEAYVSCGSDIRGIL